MIVSHKKCYFWEFHHYPIQKHDEKFGHAKEVFCIGDSSGSL